MAFSAVSILAGLQFLGIGLLGEMLSRTYFETQDKKIYSVRKVLARKLTS
jgi:hypothetical protein